MLKPMTDSELAKSASEGDREAFRRLLERHYDMMHRVALGVTGSAADAEDIAQDVCVALVRKIRGFRGEALFSTWLYRVVINACRDFARRQATSKALVGNYVAYRELDEADHADTAARLEWLQDAYLQLPPDLRETVLLVVAEEMTHAQAAAVLGCAEGTIAWRMSTARKRLKLELEADHDQ
ncbi:MAG TPA: RNA polymerase sigma factor [Afifellaceae bacterium]|nr:RNA polymerase sigma factor [Afifellaceae bacterium]